MNLSLATMSTDTDVTDGTAGDSHAQPAYAGSLRQHFRRSLGRAERRANERESALAKENARMCRRASARSATWIVTQADAPALLSLCVLLGALDIFMRLPPRQVTPDVQVLWREAQCLQILQ